MAEVIIPLSDGTSITVDKERKRKLTFWIGDLYKYRMVDSSSDVVSGTGVWVPNVDDIIYDFTMGWFRVSRVDYTTYVADLVVWEQPKSANEIGVDDVLLGTGPGYTSETYRVYVDTRVFPYRMQIDSRLKTRGSENKEVRVFRGVNITSGGEVVSAYYNQSNDYVGDMIPLELVTTDTVNNIAEKAPIMGYTSKPMTNGELLTAVTYNTAGMQTSINKLLVHITNVIRRPDESMKRVRAIDLISSFLSKTEPYVLEIPINLPVSSVDLRGKVTYTNGDNSVQDVVDEDANGKFKLLGFKYWSPTISGTPQDLTLTYALSENEEYSYLQGETANGQVVQNYIIRALPADPAYSLKLYAFPVWVNNLSGYALEYWLYDLDRQIARRVPKAAISLDPTSPSFDGLEYTMTQHLKFGVDLSMIDPAYGTWKHVQSMQIALLRDGSIRGSNWKLKFSGNQVNWFGDGLEAVMKAGSAGASTVNLANGSADKAEWLQKLYYNIDPLYDPQTEAGALEPTHFIITTKTRSYEVPVSQWNTDIMLINDVSEGETLYLRWIRRLATVDLQLGVSGLPVHNV